MLSPSRDDVDAHPGIESFPERNKQLRSKEVQTMAANKRGPEPGSDKAKHGGQAVREKYGPEFLSLIHI